MLCHPPASHTCPQPRASSGSRALIWLHVQVQVSCVKLDRSSKLP